METQQNPNERLSTRARGADTIEVDVVVESDQFSFSGPLGRRLAKMIADKCHGDEFQAAAREALELPEPFQFLITPGANAPIQEPVVETPQTIKAQSYCPYPSYYSWSKGCSSWPW